MHFGSSGIREIVTGEFVEAVYRLGLSIGASYPQLIIGGDTRTSTPALKHAILGGLLASGARVSDAGTLPTPTLALATRHFRAGVMITASHNPPEYNGVKLWNPDGSAFDDAQRVSLEHSLSSPDTSPGLVWKNMADCVPYPAAIEVHLEQVLRDFPRTYKLKVVVDAGGGAASHVTPYLLGRMGCEVVAINCQPTGIFPRPSEPTAENLTTLTQAVKATNAHLGLAHDGDGDRLVAVDELGRVAPGDKLMLLIARSLGAKKVVTTVDASMSVEHVGFEISRTRVGDTFVSQALKQGGDFGGEPAGAWIFPRISLCPDGVYAAAVLVNIASQAKLSEQVDAIPSYPLLRSSVPADPSSMVAIEEGLLNMKPLDVTRLDGLRLDMGDAWLLVRPSGTEPKIRITVEAKDLAQAEKLMKHAAKIVSARQEKSGSGVTRI